MKWVVLFVAAVAYVMTLQTFKPETWPNNKWLYPAGRWMLFEAENSPTMLLDTMTGATWKTGICNSQSGLRTHADCWVPMTRK